MGEFAYRDGPWKLVFKLGDKDLERSRDKPTIVELYQVESDITESNNLAERHPEIVKKMTADFQMLIDQGASREGLLSKNDTDVIFKTTQTQRWAPLTVE
jgi:hypothetical protein